MRPLKLVAWGLLVVFVDVHLGGPDLVPDFIGWLLVIVGLSKLRPLDRAFGTAVIAAAAEVAISLLTWFDEDSNLVAYALDVIASGLVLFFLSTAIRQRAAAGGDPKTADYLNIIRWGDVLLSACALTTIAFADDATRQSGLNSAPVVTLIALAALPLMIWLLYLLFTRAERSYLDVTWDALPADSVGSTH